MRADEQLRGRWSLTIAGHGHLADRVRQTIAAAEWGDTVDFVGSQSREDLLALLLDADALVLPSIWPENESVILLESIASGAVAIASRLGGNVDLVRDGEGGLLFEPGIAAALAERMAQLIRAPQDLARMSAWNLDRRPSLDEASTADGLSGILTGVSRSPPPAAAGAVILCGGTPDIRTELLIDQLARALPGVPLRLVWDEWADEALWHAACAYWHWDRDLNWTEARLSLSAAMKRNLAIIMPDSPIGHVLSQGSASVSLYRTAGEAITLIEAASTRDAPAAGAPSSLPSLQRLALQLRAQSDFLVKAAS